MLFIVFRVGRPNDYERTCIQNDTCDCDPSIGNWLIFAFLIIGFLTLLRFHGFVSATRRYARRGEAKLLLRKTTVFACLFELLTLVCLGFAFARDLTNSRCKENDYFVKVIYFEMVLIPLFSFWFLFIAF